MSINSGSSATVSINTAVTSGSTINVALAVSGVPAGVSASFSPTSVTSGQGATLNISVASAATAGTYLLTVTGTSGAFEHTTNVTLTVPPPPLTLSVTPISLDFGTVRQVSLLIKMVTLKNTGSGAISIPTVTVTSSSGAGSTVFTPLNFCPSSLAVGKSCSIYVLLAASRVGSQSGTLNIANSAVGSQQIVRLSAS